MLGFILVALIFAALVAVIWGREAGQKLFGCVMWAAAMGVIIVLCIGLKLLSWGNSSSSNTSAPTSSYSSPYTPPSSYVPAPTKPGIGVNLEPINANNAALLGLPRGYGVYVSSVFNGSPASNARISPGDFIVRVDGRWITGLNDLSNEEATKPIGSTVRLSVVHNLRYYTINVPTVGY